MGTFREDVQAEGREKRLKGGGNQVVGVKNPKESAALPWGMLGKAGRGGQAGRRSQSLGPGIGMCLPGSTIAVDRCMEPPTGALS